MRTWWWETTLSLERSLPDLPSPGGFLPPGLPILFTEQAHLLPKGDLISIAHEKPARQIKPVLRQGDMKERSPFDNLEFLSQP